jgi:hypothetical protein
VGGGSGYLRAAPPAFVGASGFASGLAFGADAVDVDAGVLMVEQLVTLAIKRITELICLSGPTGCLTGLLG